MKLAKAFIAVLAAVALPGAAFAGGHTSVSIGFTFGPGWYGPYPAWSYPAYYPSVPPAPVVYVEREAAADQSPAPAPVVYYCASAKAYYPEVKYCPGGWQHVAPAPQSPPLETKP